MCSVRVKGNKPTQKERYPLGEFPPDVVVSIGRQIIHRLAVGHAKITGDDFGDIFAKAIGGRHAPSPEGLADVTWNGCGWSVKTIQEKKPFKAKQIRLISGRNSPGYSQGIFDPLQDVEKTGGAVLSIWNKRLSQARNECDSMRLVCLMRSMPDLNFVLFESELHQFIPENYQWKVNKNKNFEGRYATSDAHVFTWQPHGSQFTVKRDVPASAVRFSLRRPPSLFSEQDVLKAIGYEDSWVDIVRK